MIRLSRTFCPIYHKWSGCRLRFYRYVVYISLPHVAAKTRLGFYREGTKSWRHYFISLCPGTKVHIHIHKLELRELRIIDNSTH